MSKPKVYLLDAAMRLPPPCCYIDTTSLIWKQDAHRPVAAGWNTQDDGTCDAIAVAVGCEAHDTRAICPCGAGFQ